MMSLIRKVFISLFFLAIPFSSVYAWNALGHMVIGQIAYDHLTPSAKRKVDSMVVDLNKEYPDIKSFYQIAPWPDMLRAQKIETYTHWHYKDVAFSADGAPLQDLVDSDNAIWALEKLKPVIENEKANPFERARFLAFLVHVIGDMHQPLHNVSRVTYKHPDGDRGGNLYYIKYPGNTSSNLHRLWDQGVDVFSADTSYSTVMNLSARISETYPESFFDDKDRVLDPNDWNQEGLQLATNFVYSTPEHQSPSNDYLQKGRQLAQQKAALAGYRLANILNQLLDG